MKHIATVALMLNLGVAGICDENFAGNSTLGPFTTIDVPGAAFTEAAGINPRGEIVGFYIAGTANHGFLLHEGAFTTIDVPGASSTMAFGINPRGDIVGRYFAGVAFHGFLAQ